MDKPHPMSTCEVFRLDAGNDTNGNPRRVYVTMLGGSVVRVYDEGYQGHHAVREGPERERARIAPTFATTPREYRNLLKNFGQEAPCQPST